MNFLIIPTNKAGYIDVALSKLLSKLTSKCYADKVYLSKLFESF